MLTDDQIQRVERTIHTRREYVEQAPDGAWRVVEPAGERPAVTLAELRRLQGVARARFFGWLVAAVVAAGRDS